MTDHSTGAALPAQLTVKAVLLSLVLTVILAAANAYLGLFAGLTVATAIPAAVIAMAVLRLFGPPNILENNIVATGASAGSSIAAGGSSDWPEHEYVSGPLFCPPPSFMVCCRTCMLSIVE